MIKMFTRFALLLMVFTTVSIQAQITAFPDTTICAGSTVVLYNTIVGGYGTENYVFEEIPYAPEDYEGDGITLSDDDYDGPFDIGFEFCFFGETYTEFYLGSNGWISFGGAGALTTTYTSAPIPSTDATVPKNCIMGPWEDWHPGLCLDECVKYQTIGTAPNRKLVVSWDEVPMFSCTTTIGKFQLVINETTSIIENHLTDKPNCPAWADGTGTEGVHNLEGTIAYTHPDRNSTPWTTTNESIRFVPSGVSWYEGATFIGYSDTLSVSPTVTTTYTAVVTLCDGTEYSDDVTVTVSELDETISITDVSCPGSSDGAITVTASGPNPPFTYTWATGETTNSLSDLTAGMYTVTIEDAVGCSKTFDIEVAQEEPIEIVFDDVENAQCFGYNNGSATIEVEGGTIPYDITVNGVASGSFLTGLTAGDYEVVVVDALGCTNTATLTITEPDQIFIEGSPDVTITFGLGTTLTAEPSTTDLIGVSWGPGDGTLGCEEDPCFIYTVQPAYTTDYTVAITDLNGCFAIDTITVTVLYNYEVLMPNAFTPNGDSFNDYFQGITFNALTYRLVIYNRWGQLLYETNSSDTYAGWDGTFNGEAQEVGAYVYFVEATYDTGTEIKTHSTQGSFQLIR
jgi:gliding motility-associated-like protein